MVGTATAGTTIGAGYVLEELLGDEVLGAVWRARAPDGRSVRVKLFRADGDNERIHRFQREAEALERVRHPGLLALVDRGEHDGVPFLVTEDADARTLHELIAAGPLDPARGARLVLGVAQALGAAHREGVVHRNLTATNVLVSEGDVVRVRDLGLATMVGGELPTQLTRDEARIGSAVTMAPEYVADAIVGTKGDVYALGVLLYQVATGRPPFAGRDALARKVSERSEPPSAVRPGLPGWVDALAEPLLAADPAERPEIDEVIARLERVVRTEGREEAPATPRSSAFPRALVAAALVLVAVLALGVLTLPRVAFRTVALPELIPQGLEVTPPPDAEVSLEPLEPPPVVELPPPPATGRRPAPLVATLRIRANRRVLVEVDGQAVGFAPVDVRVSSGAHLVMVALPARPDTIREQEAHVVRGADLLMEFVF